jgi:hypothetical protein
MDMDLFFFFVMQFRAAKDDCMALCLCLSLQLSLIVAIWANVTNTIKTCKFQPQNFAVDSQNSLEIFCNHPHDYVVHEHGQQGIWSTSNSSNARYQIFVLSSSARVQWARGAAGDPFPCGYFDCDKIFDGGTAWARYARTTSYSGSGGVSLVITCVGPLNCEFSSGLIMLNLTDDQIVPYSAGSCATSNQTSNDNYCRTTCGLDSDWCCVDCSVPSTCAQCSALPYIAMTESAIVFHSTTTTRGTGTPAIPTRAPPQPTTSPSSAPTSSATGGLSMANRNSAVTASSAVVGTTAALPTVGAAQIGGIVGGILALLTLLTLVGILVACRLRRRRAAATPSSNACASSEFGVLPAQDRTYGDDKDVRGPRNMYEAADTPLRA